MAASGQQRAHGFTLIELVTVLVIIAILAAIAVPTYLSFIERSKIHTAESDLTALALNLENALQRRLSYPTLNTKSTSQTKSQFHGWSPAQGADFSYTVTSTAKTYVLTASGTSSRLQGCRISIDQDDKRGISGCASISSW